MRYVHRYTYVLQAVNNSSGLVVHFASHFVLDVLLTRCNLTCNNYIDTQSTKQQTLDPNETHLPILQYLN